jgi:hypothetical protein
MSAVLVKVPTFRQQLPNFRQQRSIRVTNALMSDFTNYRWIPVGSGSSLAIIHWLVPNSSEND